MVKSVCEVPAPRVKQFPLLAKSSNTGGVYLMTSPTEGVVVSSATDARPIGYQTDNLISVYDTHVWTILDSGSTVTLTQE